MQETERFHDPTIGGQRVRGSEDQGFYGGCSDGYYRGGGDEGQKLRGGGIDGT